jgi:hypothetical protein
LKLQPKAMKIMMSKHESLECSGGARWGGLALVLACGVAQIGCGNASKKECADSVVVSFTGECPGSDGSGATGTGEGGAGATDGAGPKGGVNGEGGVFTTAGSSATGAEPEVVFQWGDADSEGRLSSGEWQVDNSKGTHRGETAVHPPALDPGGEKSMSFDCGGEAHTQLSFVAWRLTNNTELEIFDGKTSRGIIDGGGGWNPVVLDVPPGKHEYTFTARNTGTAEIGVPYVLDTFVCKKASPEPGPNGFVDFDDSYIPLEIGEDWFVDNLRGAHQGEAAVHPPALDPGDAVSMSFDCGGREHTRLRFVAWRLTNNTELELMDGTTSRGVIDGGGGWNPFVFDVPAGKHTYSFIARNTGTTPISIPYVLDTFACDYTEAMPADKGFVDFDDGFIPVEVGEGWFVDNLRGAHQGEAAVHPPVLEAGDEASMTFECASANHTSLNFVAWRLTNNAELELFDGDVSRGKIDGGGGWNPLKYEGEPGARQYTFTVRNLGETRLTSPYVLDTFQCK